MNLTNKIEKYAKKHIHSILSPRNKEIVQNYYEIKPSKVFIKISLFSKILNHIFAFELKNSGYETAGILTGIRLGEFTIISGAYPAKKIRSTPKDFDIPDDELIRIDKQRIKDGQSGFIGMYHLHPGYGAFLSHIDVAAIKRFNSFYGPCLNLVISTKKSEIEFKFFMVYKNRPIEIEYQFVLG